MATPSATPAIPVQIQSPQVRSTESRANREAANKGGDFGSEFKRELNRDRSENSATKPVAPSNPSVKEKTVASEEAIPAEQAQAQAATVDPWLAMLQGVTIATPNVVPTAELDTQLPDMQGQDQAATDVLGTIDNAAALLAQQSALKSAGGQGAAQDKGLTAQNSQPIVANELITDTRDAANFAVDTAKLRPAVLEVEQDGLAFAGELKSHLTPQAENRPQNLSTTTSAIVSKPAEIPQHHIAPPVGESRWGDAVAQRVALMLGRQEQKIEMQLNPPNLGPMEVQLNLAQDQASVVFSSQNAAVREALAAAMPRLTALLADQGFTLTNVQVASDSLQQHQQQQNQQQAAAGSNQHNSGRELGATYAALPGGEIDKMQELGALRLPVAQGGVSLFV